MKKQFIILLFMVLCLPLSIMAVNKKVSVTKVSTSVTLSDNVDYQITSATPFGDDGLVNIANTEHAVLILAQVKPSVAISNWLSKVQINGSRAVNNGNCQVKLYNRGCIIMPYAGSFKPLTVFSEQKYEGESCNNFGTENTNGYMNTLTAGKLNNRIRSFKLKRGYMVTFSTRASGRGYSRCFIAADRDLDVPTLPAVLDRKITSYRIFKWYDTGKPQLAASGGNTAACSALNVTSTYTWGTTSDMSPDVENVPHHIYENYPSPSALGACTTSPHMKTNNEPMNTDDDPKGQTEDVDAVLANWEDLMATGMRLCSPSSWDGSDYTNGTGYIKRFIDSIDARGWRCDIIDLHCYWPEGNFGTIKNWTNSTGRPVWISEWVWGASWNNNGAFASGVTESQNAETLKRICPVLNNNDCIERYYYWNGERDPSKLYKNDNLTEAGRYYASINSDLGYNGKYDFVPTTPPQYGPTKFTQKVLSSGKTRLTWRDSNGEYNQLMEVQMKDALGRWVVLDTIAQKEAAANYSYEVDNADENVLYRIHLIDLNGKEYYTSNELCLGDAFEVDGQIYYAGGNLFANGEFDLGFTGWTNGTGQPLAEPQFQVVGDGGYQGGSYLQSHLNGGASAAASVKTTVNLVAGENYVFRIVSCNGGNYLKFSLSANGSTLSKEVAKAANSTEWGVNTFLFNAETYTYGILSCYALAAKAQIDAIQLRQLFPTREAAIADGVEKARLRAEAQKTYNTEYPFLNDDLTTRMSAITGSDDTALAEIETILAEHLSAIRKKAEAKFIAATLKAVKQKPCPAYEEMLDLLHNAEEAMTGSEIITSVDQLQALMQENLAFTRSSKQPRTPSFTSEKSTGWEVKVGTYTDGDQRTATKFGKTCWNAWWSTTNQNATMEIRQTVTNLPEGYYQLECKATTEHFCISDQHGYLKNGDVEAVTQTLSKGYFDLPVPDPWETLTTTPIYVEAGGSLTLGFVSSKQGAETGKWHSFGNASGTSDNREGWWCATDFVLKYHAIDDETGIENLNSALLKNEGTVYDLSGRKLFNVQRPISNGLQNGIYIKVEEGKAKRIVVR
ncbi:MAG: hypothetical protein J6W52_00110 [Bacteroidaceae bacterium]|nr:hypothetical protein [Bacteroidaceae bacterium]